MELIVMDETPSPQTPDPSAPAGGPGPAAQDQPPRRGFFTRFLAVAIGGFVGIVPAAAGLFTFLDPLKKPDDDVDGPNSGDDGFIAVGSRDSLPLDGSPRLFNVMADQKDAWTIQRDVAIGSVFIRQDEDGQLQAFNATCTHLGCFVSSLPNGTFSCPCHDSEFDENGQLKKETSKGTESVALRGLDTLDVKVREEDNMVLVKYQQFRAGIPEKIAKS